MRSGWHIEFEAHLAVSRARAEQNEAFARMARAMEPWNRAAMQLGVSAARALASIGRSMAALRAAQPPASEVSRHLEELARTRRRLP